ncbi:hypothetical protein PG990_004106 [Apiospora arundinis]
MMRPVPLSSPLAVLLFYVVFLTIVIGGGILFARSNSPPEGTERTGESGEGSEYDSDDESGSEEEEGDPYDVGNAHAFYHYSRLPDTDVESLEWER